MGFKHEQSELLWLLGHASANTNFCKPTLFVTLLIFQSDVAINLFFFSLSRTCEISSDPAMLPNPEDTAGKTNRPESHLSIRQKKKKKALSRKVFKVHHFLLLFFLSQNLLSSLSSIFSSITTTCSNGCYYER